MQDDHAPDLSAFRGLANRALRGLSDDKLLNRAELEILSPAELAISVLDPATGETIALVKAQTENEASSAIERAQGSFKAWSEILGRERGARLRKWAELIRASCDDLATIISCEQGKPIAESLSEVEYGAGFLEWFAAEAERAYGSTIPNHRIGVSICVTWQPVGVVLAITPWNFPMAMIARKAGAALAAGSPVIVKPAPETPLSALALETLAIRACIPSECFQVLVGDAQRLTDTLVRNTAVRAVSFTGSTDVGKKVYKLCSADVKKISLELGGHAPFIVFSDAELSTVIKDALTAKFVTSGQDCLAVNRFFIQRTLYEEFCQRFTDAAVRLVVGHGLDPGTQIGPMTRRSVVKKCLSHTDDALMKGARLYTPRQTFSEGTNFVLPTVLADVTDEMRISKEETFGPVAAITPFAEEDEVIQLANASSYGLAAYLYTRDAARIARVTRSLEHGLIGVNTSSFTGPPVPFGGFKNSGLGREGGSFGMLEFMQQKFTCLSTIPDLEDR